MGPDLGDLPWWDVTKVRTTTSGTAQVQAATFEEAAELADALPAEAFTTHYDADPTDRVFVEPHSQGVD